jgi:hypothetical protein
MHTTAYPVTGARGSAGGVREREEPASKATDRAKYLYISLLNQTQYGKATIGQDKE